MRLKLLSLIFLVLPLTSYGAFNCSSFFEKSAQENVLPKAQLQAQKIDQVIRSLREVPQDLNQESPLVFKDVTQSSIAVMEEFIHHSAFERNRFLRTVYFQTYMQLKHAAMNGVGGRYAFSPTLRALRNTRDLIELVTKDLEKPVIVKAMNPARVEAELSEIKARDQKRLQKLLDNPQAHADRFLGRLKKEGPQASFPEFADVVRHLELSLRQEISKQGQNPTPGAVFWLNRAMENLSAIRTRGYRYYETLNGLEEALAAIDALQRSSATRFPPYYYVKNWQHYAQALKGIGSEFVVVPTISDLTFQDLIKINGLPLGIAGVSRTPVYADGYLQSSLEFWLHDFNHNRRLWQSQYVRARELGLSMKDYVKQTRRFIEEKILPLIKENPEDSPSETYQKRLMGLLIFEISHEEGQPIDEAYFKEALLRKPNGIARFVFETVSDDLSKTEFSLRSAAAILPFVFRKLQSEFYDKADNRSPDFVPEDYRTWSDIAAAAIRLNESLKLGIDPQIFVRDAQDDAGIRGPFRHGLIELSYRHPEKVTPFSEAEGVNLMIEPLKNPEEYERALRVPGAK